MRFLHFVYNNNLLKTEINRLSKIYQDQRIILRKVELDNDD